MFLELGGFRIKIVLLVFIITLSLALGVQYLSYQKRVIEPIIRVFSEIDGVIQIETERQHSGIKLIIALGDCDRFDQVMHNILSAAERFDSLLKIEIKDAASSRLEQIYHEMHYAIEQAVVIGDFREMAVVIEEIAQQNNIKYRITIDREYVYLQLHEADNYLYQLICRHNQPIAVRFER